MTLRAAVLIAFALLALPASAAAAPYAPIPTCAPGPADCPSWHTGDVAISWQYAPGWTDIACNAQPVTTDGVSQRTCSVTYGEDVYARTVNVRRDATPPQVTAATPSRAPDEGGWYNRPLSVTFSGTDGVSGIAACSAPSYAGGDGPAVTVAGTCTDVAGNTSAVSTLTFRYDATPPAVTAAPDRAPDARGWYRRPVTIGFTGTDATSGVAACTEPARYAGPDRAPVVVSGTCRDAAGNVAPEGRLELRYDATAPALSGAAARVERGAARVSWRRPGDAAAIEIERRPGINGRAATIVYRGRGQAFLDRTVKPGSTYRYEIRAIDAAGNVGRAAVSTAPAGPLRRPAEGATVRGRVTLAWQAVASARFYNVQLYRGRTKVLSVWPQGTTLRLPQSWVHAGRRQRLAPGLYRWYVWPARGTRERPAYGRVLGSSTFRVAG